MLKILFQDKNDTQRLPTNVEKQLLLNSLKAPMYLIHTQTSNYFSLPVGGA